MYATTEWYTDAKKAAELVSDAVNHAKKNRDVRETRWRRHGKAYFLQHDDTAMRGTTYPYKSKLKLPTELVHVEGCATQLALALLANNPMVLVKPRTDKDGDSAKRMGWLLHYQFVEDIGIKDKLPKWCRSLCTYGEKWVKVGWTVTTKRVHPRKFNPKTGEWDKESAKERTTVEGHPTVDGLNRWEVYVDPWATTVENARNVTHQLTMTPEQLQQLYESDTDKESWEEENVTAVIKAANEKAEAATSDKNAEMNTADQERLTDLEEQKRRTSWMPGQHDKRIIQLWDYWEDDVNILCAGQLGKLITLRRRSNPYEHGKKPFIKLDFIATDEQFDGLGVLDAMGDLPQEKDTRRNQRNDNINIAMNPLRLYNKGLVEGKMLASRPHGDVPCRGNPNDAVAYLTAPDTTGPAMRESAQMDQEMEQASGLTPSVQGMEGQPGDTARGYAMRQQAANARFEMVIAGLVEPLRQLVKMVHSMDRQYFGKSDRREGAVRVMGDDGAFLFKRYTFADIEKDYAFEFTVDPKRANPALFMQQMANHLGVIGGIPEAVAGLDFDRINLAAFEALGFRENAKEFLKGADSTAQREAENFKLWGTFPPVSEGQDHLEHLESMELLVQQGGFQSFQSDRDKYERALHRFDAHWKDHSIALQRARLAEQGAPA